MCCARVATTACLSSSNLNPWVVYYRCIKRIISLLMFPSFHKFSCFAYSALYAVYISAFIFPFSEKIFSMTVAPCLFVYIPFSSYEQLRCITSVKTKERSEEGVGAEHLFCALWTKQNGHLKDVFFSLFVIVLKNLLNFKKVKSVGTSIIGVFYL